MIHPLFAENSTMTAVFLGIMAIVISFLLMRSSRYFSRRHEANDGQTSPLRARLEHRGEPTSAPPEVLQWDVKMHETARELAGQIDAKLSALQALVIEADRAAARLEAALRADAAGRESSPPPDTGPQVSSAAGPLAPPAGSEHQAAALRSGGDRAGLDLTTVSPASGDRRKEEVSTLAAYGYDAQEIAQRTGLPIGEVELIISLQKPH